MACGSAVIPRRPSTAACLSHAVQETEEQIAAGRYRLVFVAPERLLTPRFLQLIAPLQSCAPSPSTKPTASAIGVTTSGRNIASWLSSRARFPQASVHAYTATATRARARRHHRAAPSHEANGAGRHFRSSQSASTASFPGSMRGRRCSKCCGVILVKRPSSTASAGTIPSPWRRR